MCSSCSVLEHKEHKHILLSESFICFLVEKNMGMNGVMRATQETKTSHQRAKKMDFWEVLSVKVCRLFTSRIDSTEIVSPSHGAKIATWINKLGWNVGNVLVKEVVGNGNSRGKHCSLLLRLSMRTDGHTCEVSMPGVARALVPTAKFLHSWGINQGRPRGRRVSSRMFYVPFKD